MSRITAFFSSLYRGLQSIGEGFSSISRSFMNDSPERYHRQTNRYIGDLNNHLEDVYRHANNLSSNKLTPEELERQITLAKIIPTNPDGSDYAEVARKNNENIQQYWTNTMGYLNRAIDRVKNEQGSSNKTKNNG